MWQERARINEDSSVLRTISFLLSGLSNHARCRLRSGEGQPHSASDDELALARKIERILESKLHAKK